MALLSLPSSLTRRLTLRTTLVLIFAILNLKALPLSWHIRLFYHLFRNARKRPWSLTDFQLQDASPSISTSPLPASSSTHPIFAVSTLTTHAPLLESDYNLHKSNSTYFSDLDISRTALVTRLLSPGFPVLARELAQHDPPVGGNLNVLLGAVHASFRREVKMYERYEVRSRLLAWDAKWLVIGSWFVRPGKGGKGGAEGEVVLASALSKYVVKKGRWTVAPERCLRAAGLLPPLEEKEEGYREGGGESLGVSKWLDVTKGDEPEEKGLTAVNLPAAPLAPEKAAAGAEVWWNKARIEAERARGLELVKAWMALDGALLEEFAKVPGP